MSDRAAQVIGLIVLVVVFVLGFLLLSSIAAAVGTQMPWDRR